MTYYKFLEPGGIALFTGRQWPLPTKNDDGSWTAGKWMPALRGKPNGQNGYLISRVRDLLNWYGDELFELEVNGEVHPLYPRTTSPCRLVKRIEAFNERARHHLICDFVEQILPAFEAQCPNDDRLRQSIEVHRRYADGEATLEEYSASRDEWIAVTTAVWDTTDAFLENFDFEWQIQHLLETLDLSRD